MHRSFLFVFSLFAQIITFSEPIDTAARINQLLSAGEERMTLGADFNADVASGGTRFDLLSACTADDGFFILRMNSLFHMQYLFLCATFSRLTGLSA